MSGSFARELIDDPDLAVRLTSVLAKGNTAVPPDLSVSYFGQPHISDPFNTRAILSAVAMVNHVECAWSVKTSTKHVRGVTFDEIIERLTAGLADEIAAKPNQTKDADKTPCRVV